MGGWVKRSVSSEQSTVSSKKGQQVVKKAM